MPGSAGDYTDTEMKVAYVLRLIDGARHMRYVIHYLICLVFLIFLSLLFDFFIFFKVNHSRADRASRRKGYTKIDKQIAYD